MSRASFPEIPQDALKSHAQPARIERVWRRLQLDLNGAPRSRGPLAWWLALGALGIFGLGVGLGTRLRAPSVELAAVAEPRSALPTPGAGPVAQPGTPAKQSPDAPAQKRVRSRRALSTGEAEVTPDYVESYGEPAGSVASEPVPVSGPPEWETLAETGDFGAAKAALDRAGGFQRASDRASASQLLVLADIARASGEREEAAQALRRVLSTYDSAPEAPLAAWTLGNLLEQAGDRSGAADAYATYRRLSPTGDFAEDAAARQVDAALSQRNLELGTRAMEEYAQNFPKGRRLAELRKRLNALAAPPDATAAAPADSDDDDDANEPSADAPATPPASAREH
jgi:TolA-binding protein